MKFRLFILIQLSSLCTLQAETLLSWNSSTSLSQEELIKLTDQISSRNPDLVCLRAENVAQFDEILASSHPYLFYDQGLLIAGKAPIKELLFTPLNQTNEGILEFDTGNHHVYIPIFHDSQDQYLWEATSQKIWYDQNPLALLCTHSQSMAALEQVIFATNQQAGIFLCGGPSSANGRYTVDNDGNVILEGEASVSTRESEDGSRWKGTVSGEISRDNQGNVTKSGGVRVEYFPGKK